MERRKRKGRHRRERARYRSRARKHNRRVRPSFLGTARELLQWEVTGVGFLAVLCVGCLG